MKACRIAVTRKAPSAVHCSGRRLSECLLIIVRETTHVAETTGECDTRDGFVENWIRQHLPSASQSHLLEEVHRRVAAERFECMENTTRARVRGYGQPLDRNGLVPMSFDIFLHQPNLGWRDSPG